MSIRKISEFVEATSPQNSDKLLLERNGSGKSITVGNLLNDLNNKTRINYLRPVLRTATKNGVTCTDNGDGTFTLSGTSNSSEQTIFWATQDNSLFYLKTGQYKVVGTPSNTSAFIGGTNIDYADYSGKIIDHIEGTSLSLGIVVPPNYSTNNELFKPMITDDLSATYDNFVSYNDSFVTGINSSMNVDLLWENKSPTSEFADQTVSLDLRKYKMVYVVTRRVVSNNNFHGSKILKKGESGQIFSYLNGYGLADREVVNISDTGITFGVGVREGNTNNEYGIPIYIYGIK